MFTLNHLGLPRTLTRCLATTNIIESPNGGVRQITGRVNRWKNGNMVLRWAASAFLSAEKNFRRIMGYKDLWTLETILGRSTINRIDKYQNLALNYTKDWYSLNFIFILHRFSDLARGGS
jgi:putative transposase